MQRAKLFAALALALSLILSAAAPARAATELPYTAQAFQAAQAQGKPIVIHITAPWCPVCAKQRPIVAQLLTDPAFQNLVVYQVDFDTQKDIVRAFGAQMQSTFVVFHGPTEQARSTGETNPEAIRTLLAKANG